MHHLRRFPSGLARRRAHRRVSRIRTIYLSAYLLGIVTPTAYALHEIVHNDPPRGGLLLVAVLSVCVLGAAAFWLFTGAARMRLDVDLAIDGNLLVAANDGERLPTAVDLHGAYVSFTGTRKRAGMRWVLRIRSDDGRRGLVIPLNDPRVGQTRCVEDLRALAAVLSSSPEPEGEDVAREIRTLIPWADPRPDDARALDDCIPYIAPRGPLERFGAALWACVYLAVGAGLLALAVDANQFQHDLIASGRHPSGTATRVTDFLAFAAVAVLAIGLYRLCVKPFRRGPDAYRRLRPTRDDEAPVVPSADSHRPVPTRPAEAGPRSLRFAAYPPREFGRIPRRVAAAVAAPVAALLALAGPVIAAFAMLQAAQADGVPAWYWPATGGLLFGLPALLYWTYGNVVRHVQAVNRSRLWLDGHRLVCDGPRGVLVGDLRSRRVRVRTVHGNAVLYVPVDGWWHRYPVLLTQGRTDTWRPIGDLHRLVAALRTSPFPAGRAAATQILSIAPLAPGETLPKLRPASAPRVPAAVPAMPGTVAGRGVRAVALVCAAVFLVLVGLTAASQAGGRPFDAADGTVDVLVEACHDGPPIGPHGFGRLAECLVVLPDGSRRTVPGGEFTPTDVGRRVSAAYADGPVGDVLVRADREREETAAPMLVFALCGAALLFIQACRLAFRRPPVSG